MDLNSEADDVQLGINESLIKTIAEIMKVLKQMDVQLKASVDLSMMQQEQMLQLKRRIEKLEFPNRDL